MNDLKVSQDEIMKLKERLRGAKTALTDAQLETLFLLLDRAIKSVSFYKLSIMPDSLAKRDPDRYTKRFGVGKYVQIHNDEKNDEPAVFIMKEVLDKIYLSPPLPPGEGPVFFSHLPLPLSFYIPILDEAIKAVLSKKLTLLIKPSETNT